MNYEVNINVKLETDHKVIVEASCKEEAVDIAQHNYEDGFYNEEIAEAISNEEWETCFKNNKIK